MIVSRLAQLRAGANLSADVSREGAYGFQNSNRRAINGFAHAERVAPKGQQYANPPVSGRRRLPLAAAARSGQD
jgi:hypothetical protein